MRAAAELSMINHQPEARRTASPSLSHAEPQPNGTTAVSPPAHVRAIGVDLTEDDRTYIHRKLRSKLDKFGRSIHRISVRVTDLNGPRGGVDQACSIKVVLKGLPSVVVIRRHAAIQNAIDAALHATEHAVRGVVGRRRMKPLRGRITRAA